MRRASVLIIIKEKGINVFLLFPGSVFLLFRCAAGVIFAFTRRWYYVCSSPVQKLFLAFSVGCILGFPQRCWYFWLAPGAVVFLPFPVASVIFGFPRLCLYFWLHPAPSFLIFGFPRRWSCFWLPPAATRCDDDERCDDGDRR